MDKIVDEINLVDEETYAEIACLKASCTSADLPVSDTVRYIL